ncbi:Probable serine/threonine-protein kinase PBL11, partial [Linum perenne]
MGNCIATTPADPDNIPSSTTVANNPEPTTASIDVARHINGSRSEISSTTETASCNNNGDVITTASPLPLKIFKLAELKIATRNFRADMVLGEGGFGTVYKGWIDEKSFAPSKVSVGFPVAVKRSNPGSSQGLEEWQDIKSSQKIGTAELNEGLYWFRQTDLDIQDKAFVSNCSISLFDLWHFRLGHSSLSSLCKSLGSKTQDNFHCRVCPLAKQHKLKFSCSTSHATE